jgi:hypothetical protein
MRETFVLNKGCSNVASIWVEKHCQFPGSGGKREKANKASSLLDDTASLMLNSGNQVFLKGKMSFRWERV